MLGIFGRYGREEAILRLSTAESGISILEATPRDSNHLA